AHARRRSPTHVRSAGTDGGAADPATPPDLQRAPRAPWRSGTKGGANGPSRTTLPLWSLESQPCEPALATAARRAVTVGPCHRQRPRLSERSEPAISTGSAGC